MFAGTIHFIINKPKYHHYLVEHSNIDLESTLVHIHEVDEAQTEHNHTWLIATCPTLHSALDFLVNLIDPPICTSPETRAVEQSSQSKIILQELLAAMED